MSGLKSIELQVALPRTQTAGKLQDQLQQRSSVQQEHLAQKNVEEDLKNKKTVTEMNNTEKKRLHNNQQEEKEKKKFEKRKKGKSQGTAEDKKIASHETIQLEPYKGRNFDVKW